MKTNNEMTGQGYDITKERAVRKKRFYYHITHPDNVDKILKRGLIANDEGMIFVITDMLVSDPVALHQLFLNHYAVFVVCSNGITGKVIRDRVAEFTASYQRIVLQQSISPRYLSYFGSIIIDPDEPTPWDIFFLQRTYGISKAEAMERWYKERSQRCAGIRL